MTTWLRLYIRKLRSEHSFTPSPDHGHQRSAILRILAQDHHSLALGTRLTRLTRQWSRTVRWKLGAWPLGKNLADLKDSYIPRTERHRDNTKVLCTPLVTIFEFLIVVAMRKLCRDPSISSTFIRSKQTVQSPAFCILSNFPTSSKR